MILAYDGTRYAGWQVQPARETIQGVLEMRLSRMLSERVRVAGAGRTDAGVHARGQVANFLTRCRIPEEGLRRGLNARLPSSIRVLRADEVAAAFHARTDALSKEYRYRLAVGEVLSPFEAPYMTAVRGPLDVEAMRDAARRIAGRHDFTSFCASACRLDDKTRQVMVSEIEGEGERIEYRVSADGFLHHMVRNIVGTLLLVGKGRLKPEEIEGILSARDRRAAGPCAPAQGLSLERVLYGGHV
jgi:tRNA pseudouridine38-40 synthase